MTAVACLVLALSGATLGAVVVSGHYEKRIVRMEAEYNQRIEAAAKATAEQTIVYRDIKDEALEKRAARADSLLADNRRLYTEHARLRDEVANSRAAADTLAAYADHAATLKDILADCSREYAEVAAKATGHTDDIRTLIDAWPRSLNDSDQDKHIRRSRPESASP